MDDVGVIAALHRGADDVLQVLVGGQLNGDAGLLGEGVGHLLPHLGAVGGLDGRHLDGLGRGCRRSCRGCTAACGGSGGGAGRAAAGRQAHGRCACTDDLDKVATRNAFHSSILQQRVGCIRAGPADDRPGPPAAGQPERSGQRAGSAGPDASQVLVRRRGPQNIPATPDCPLKKAGDAGVCVAAAPAAAGHGAAKTASFSEQDSVQRLWEMRPFGAVRPHRRRTLLCTQYSGFCRPPQALSCLVF